MRCSADGEKKKLRRSCIARRRGIIKDIITPGSLAVQLHPPSTGEGYCQTGLGPTELKIMVSSVLQKKMWWSVFIALRAKKTYY